jgi:outer membrane immunogenic protein
MNSKSIALAAAVWLAALGAAQAADLPSSEPPPPVQPLPAVQPVAYNWTGFYIGGELGGGWHEQQTTLGAGSPQFPSGSVLNPTNGSGFIGGGVVGYNYQINQFVFGVEGAFLGTSQTGSETTLSPGGSGFTANTSSTLHWVTTATGRIGYAWGPALLFAKGGWAWAHTTSSGVTDNAAGVAVSTTSSSLDPNGWTVGGGLEWSFAPNWSVKAEYDYIGFQRDNFNTTQTTIATGAVTSVSRSTLGHEQLATIGLVYQFNFGL